MAVTTLHRDFTIKIPTCIVEFEDEIQLYVCQDPSGHYYICKQFSVYREMGHNYSPKVFGKVHTQNNTIKLPEDVVHGLYRYGQSPSNKISVVQEYDVQGREVYYLKVLDKADLKVLKS